MTLDQYWQCVKQAVHDHPEWRVGQAAFNVLWEHRRDLSEQIRGTDLDPFHKREISAEFREWITEHWDVQVRKDLEELSDEQSTL